MARPRQFDHDHALDQAVQAFWSRGYDGSSIQDLCGVMGLNPPSLYGAFGDKRALFLAALERYAVRSQAGFRAAVGDAQGAEGLRRMFDRLTGRLTSPGGERGCLVTNAAAEEALGDPEAAALVKGHYGALEDMFRRLLDQAAQRGELRAGAGSHSAGLLLCLAQGLNVMAKTSPDPGRLQEIADQGLGVILANIARDN